MSQDHLWLLTGLGQLEHGERPVDIPPGGGRSLR